MIRYSKPRNLVRRRSDGTLWTADGAVPFPLTGWNFARVCPLPTGWRVITSERFVTYKNDDFDVLWNTGNDWENSSDGRRARGLSALTAGAITDD